MGAGISLSKKQIEAIMERHHIQTTFDNHVQSIHPYMDGWYVPEDFSVEEKYWKELREINRILYPSHKK